MSRLWKAVCGAVLGSGALLALSTGYAAAQGTADPTGPRVTTTQDYWQQRVLRNRSPLQAGPRQTATVPGARRGWSPLRQEEAGPAVRTVFEVMQAQAVEPGDGLLADDMIPMPGEMDRAPLAADQAYGDDQAYAGHDAYENWSGCGDCAYGACGPGYGQGWCGPFWGLKRLLHQAPWWLSNFSVFFGVHGFKGIADQGRNGNFGFHEGVNWGAPLGGPFNLGYQLGVQGVHSDFSGHQATDDDRFLCADRDQVFFTGGVFKRAPCGGLQGGVVFDLLHDRYYASANVRQIRTESALVLSGGVREIGFWGNFGVGDDVLDSFDDGPNGDGIVLLKPKDTYSIFYRRHFSGGGQGRIWAGLSGNGDGLIGGDCLIPLGTRWALENSFTYLVPKGGSGHDAQQEETWNVSIHLVCYPFNQARCAINSPFHPLFRVADNGLFLLNTQD